MCGSDCSRYESVLPGVSLQPQIIWKREVRGTSPSLVCNFVENRKTTALMPETRYKWARSLMLGHIWFFGGSLFNLTADRDFAQAVAELQF